MFPITFLSPARLLSLCLPPRPFYRHFIGCKIVSHHLVSDQLAFPHLIPHHIFSNVVLFLAISFASAVYPPILVAVLVSHHLVSHHGISHHLVSSQFVFHDFVFHHFVSYCLVSHHLVWAGIGAWLDVQPKHWNGRSTVPVKFLLFFWVAKLGLVVFGGARMAGEGMMRNKRKKDKMNDGKQIDGEPCSDGRQNEGMMGDKMRGDNNMKGWWRSRRKFADKKKCMNSISNAFSAIPVQGFLGSIVRQKTKGKTAKPSVQQAKQISSQNSRVLKILRGRLPRAPRPSSRVMSRCGINSHVWGNNNQRNTTTLPVFSCQSLSFKPCGRPSTGGSTNRPW